jgi:PII-like signaling protein
MWYVAVVLSKGPAKKVIIYVNADTRHHLGPLYEAILNFLLHKGVSGATATRALSGFGGHRQIHTPRIEVMAEHLPIRIEFVESARKIDELLPTLYDMVSDGLIEVQDTTVVKVAKKERKPESGTPHQETRGPAKLLRVFLGEADELDGEPLYQALVKRLRMMEVSGATVYRGILGYGAKGHTHKESFWHLSRDMPIMISVIDSAEKIESALQAVESMLGDGLIVVSDVDMIRLVHKMPESADASS